MIACADGATGGNGLGRTHAAYIHKLGANAITLGECCFYKKDLTENLDKTPYVLRPENLSFEAPGIGAKVFKAGNERVALAVLLGQNGFNRLHGNNPFTALPPLLERLKNKRPSSSWIFTRRRPRKRKPSFTWRTVFVLPLSVRTLVSKPRMKQS